MTKFALCISALACSFALYGQSQLPNLEGLPPKLIIISAGTKEMVTDSNGVTLKYQVSQGPLFYLSPSWIQTVNVVKGKKAVDQYGGRAENGVILISLSEGAYKQMPKTDRKRFKRKKNHHSQN